jgi:hypothetical protein
MNKLTVMVIAIAALLIGTSGAFAAQKYVITSTKQIKPSVMQSLKGKPGTPGAQGATGATGDTGHTGSQGSRGPAGPQGADGAEGAPGPKGATGSQGSVGPKGEQGERGSQGVKGDTGATGSKGDKGDTGATGSKGDTGPVGISGYQEVNVDNAWTIPSFDVTVETIVACPTGKKIISGGWWTNHPDITSIGYNGPGANDTAWSVSARVKSISGGQGNYHLQAIAICANVN